MKSTAAVTFSQICALYVVLRCSPASTAPHMSTAVVLDQYRLNSHTTIKPYYASYSYNNILPYIVGEPRQLKTLDQKIEENISATASDTPPVIIGVINDDKTKNYDYNNWSKQVDLAYDQLQSLLEALTSAKSKIKAMSMRTKQSFGEELTTNSFSDLVTTEIPHTRHQSTTNMTAVWLHFTAESTNVSTPWPPTTTTIMPDTTTTQMPITTTMQSPKQNKFICTLCVIIVNE